MPLPEPDSTRPGFRVLLGEDGEPCQVQQFGPVFKVAYDRPGFWEPFLALIHGRLLAEAERKEIQIAWRPDRSVDPGLPPLRRTMALALRENYA